MRGFARAACPRFIYIRSLRSRSRALCSHTSVAVAHTHPAAAFTSPPTILYSDLSLAIRNKISKAHPTTVDVSLDILKGVTDQPIDVVVIAVKPQNCTDLYKTLKPALKVMGKQPMVLSICAGVPINSEFVERCRRKVRE